MAPGSGSTRPSPRCRGPAAAPRQVLHAIAAGIAAHVQAEPDTCRVLMEARSLAAHNLAWPPPSARGRALRPAAGGTDHGGRAGRRMAARH